MLSKNKNKIIFSLVVLILASLSFFFYPKEANRQTTGFQENNSSFPISSNVQDSNTSTTTKPVGLLKTIGNSISGLIGIDDQKISILQAGLVKQLPMSISGYTLSNQGKDLIFMEKATGHIAKLDLRSGSTTIISNTTLPGVEEAYWGAEGTNLQVIARYLKTEWNIESLSGSVPLVPKTTASSTDGRQLASVILDSRSYAFAISPDGKRVFSLNHTPGGEAIGLVSDFSFKKPTEVFRNPLTEWLPTWVAPNLVVLQTKSSGGAAGFLFSLNLSTGRFTKILGPINGFTSLTSANLLRIAYSGSSDGFKLKVYDPSADKVSSYGLQTLPEKCAWTADSLKLYCAVPDTLPSKALLPDNWYSGEVSFADSIWLIDTKTGETRELFQHKTSSDIGEFDAINLSLNGSNQKLYFQNKNDSTLWSLDLKENSFAPIATTSAR